MNTPQPRDDFYGICGVAAALILALALGVPAFTGSADDHQAAARPAPATGAARSTVEAVVRPLAQLLQPGTTAAYGG